MDGIISNLYEDFKRFEPVRIESLNKGWSSDDKYIVVTTKGKYLLRLSDKKQSDRAQRQVHIINQAVNADIPTQQVIDHGTCLNDTKYFILLSWIEAADAEKEILKYSTEAQYDFGRVAGGYLKKIHGFHSTYQLSDTWDELFNRKIDKKLEMYKNCELKYENDERLIEAVNTYRKNLSSVPLVVHHGDFHLGNMLIGRDHTLYVIDYDRHDVGAAWEEFNRLPFCYDVSPAFARGLVDAYFEDRTPEIFWKMLCLYTATNALSALPWAVPFGMDEIATMIKQTESLYAQYNDFTRVIPQWYRR